MTLGMHDENQQVANIKVIGIGGGGSNAIDHMINEKVAGVRIRTCRLCNVQRRT